MTKPFSLEELLARLQAVLRRPAALGESGDVLRVSDLSSTSARARYAAGGASSSSRATEFDLLRFLMLNARTVVSKAQILDRVWHYDFVGPQQRRRAVRRLPATQDRHREGAALIHTVRGVGYVLRAPRASDG